MIPPGPASHTHDNNARMRGQVIAAQNEARATAREVEKLRRHLKDCAQTLLESVSRESAAAARLAAIDSLHQPDPDNNHACQCGLSNPCPTRRALDGGTP